MQSINLTTVVLFIEDISKGQLCSKEHKSQVIDHNPGHLLPPYLKADGSFTGFWAFELKLCQSVRSVRLPSSTKILYRTYFLQDFIQTL